MSIPASGSCRARGTSSKKILRSIRRLTSLTFQTDLPQPHPVQNFPILAKLLAETIPTGGENFGGCCVSKVGRELMGGLTKDVRRFWWAVLAIAPLRS